MPKLICSIAMTIALAGSFVGCDRAHSLSEIEEKERSTRLYTNAMDDYRAGRLDAAIRGFERVVLDEPKSYSAHFQLATLLHDVRKDYIGAISHYRAYLALRPASDKATVAIDRAKLCETLLAADVLKKSASGRSDALKKENEQLAAERDELVAKVRRLSDDLEKAERTIAGLTKDNASQHALLSKLAAADDSGARPMAAKEALKELKAMDAEDTRRRIRPTDAELLDDEDEKPVVANHAAEIARYRAEAEQEEAKDRTSKFVVKPVRAGQKPTSPKSAVAHKTKSVPLSRPDTYTVREGDTLFAISIRFYGNASKWRAIRELNKAVVPMDGRLRAGQILKLP